MSRLEGKIAIITGASSGIGEAAALRFAEEGAIVVLAARRESALEALKAKIEAAGGSALAVPTDVGSLEDCKNLVAKTLEAYGRIDILVNNAGVADKHRGTLDVTDEFWEKIIHVDLTSVFQLTREVLPTMVEQKYGSIVNVSSIGGVFGSAGAAYSAAKSGLNGFTKNVAMQYADIGIRCNATAPGPTPTELNTPEAMQEFDPVMREITGRYMNITLPESTVEDQANGILFFASDEAKAITGQVLVIDHGWTL